MQFFKPPYKHQLDIIRMSLQHPNLGLFWEMGTGKTAGVINILRLKYADVGKIRNTLIVSPVVTLFNWKEEILIHSKIPKEKINVIEGTGKKRLQLVSKAVSSNNIIIMNYEALLNKDVYTLIKEWKPEIVIADEAHYIKNPKARRSKALVSISDNATYRYALTGTPILNKPTDIFMIYRFLDKGETFSKDFFSFQYKYMRDANAAWKSKQGYFPKWEPRPEKYKELSDKMYQIATRITKQECLELPPLVKVKRYVDLGKEQAKLYKEMLRDFVTFIQDNDDKPHAVVAQLALTKGLRLQQIVSGFVKTDTGEEILIKDNPRLKAVEELLEELTPSHKVILWCSFIKDYEQLADVCKKLKLKHTFITGGMSARRKQESIEKFRSDSGTRVIIANRGAGGIGINLVEASYSIVYSRNFSLAEELQSEARNHRGGSEIHERITKIDLCARGTYDERTLEALEKKQNISDAIIDWASSKGVENE